jgi:hypothetical protein
MGRFSINLTLIFSIALLAVSCSHGVSQVETRALASPNPTSYLFSLSLQQVYTNALDAFSIEHQAADPVFGRSHDLHLEGLFSECATNAVFGEAMFRDPANTNDIYLHSFDTPIVISSVYHGRYGNMPFIATFHLHLTGNDTDTTVTATAGDTKVVNGTKFGFGPCGPGQGNNYEPVKPTTVEEYTILRYLGNYLGVTNMPVVIVPKS